MCVICATCLGWVAGRRGNCSCVCTFARISGGGGVKSLTKALLGLAALVAVVVALDLAQSVQAQSEEEQAGRIVARRLDDGRTEFGWRPAGGARVLPRLRYFPTDAAVGRWLNSSPVEVDGAEIGRINARLRDDGRIEFAFTPTDGERIAPPARYFPADARVGRWLRSTEITIGSPAPATGFIAVSAGEFHTCALRTNGANACWGDNEEGQTRPPAGRLSAVSAGGFHTCGLRESGQIVCWGANYDGQTDPPAGRDFIAVSAGFSHTCAIRESGEIECWGRNNVWFLNEETQVAEAVYTGQLDAPAGPFTAVSAGAEHTCALREDGAIECWGNNSSRQTDAPAGPFIAVSARSYQTCALRESGEIECWGANASGLAPAGPFIAFSVGDWHTCGLRESGAIACWGSNLQGQIDAPTGRFIAVSAGHAHTCALRESGEIECWGRNTRDGWNAETETTEEVYAGQTDAPTP